MLSIVFNWHTMLFEISAPLHAFGLIFFSLISVGCYYCSTRAFEAFREAQIEWRRSETENESYYVMRKLMQSKDYFLATMLFGWVLIAIVFGLCVFTIFALV